MRCSRMSSVGFTPGVCCARTTESTHVCQYCVSTCTFCTRKQVLLYQYSETSTAMKHRACGFRRAGSRRAYVIRPHTSAYVRIRQLKQVGHLACGFAGRVHDGHTSYVRIRPHTSAYVSIRQLKQVRHLACGFRQACSLRDCVRTTESTHLRAARAPAAVLHSIRQHTSAYAVLYRIHTSAYVSIRLRAARAPAAVLGERTHENLRQHLYFCTSKVKQALLY